MNNCVISGNLTRDIELKYSQSGMAIARFTVAVQRKFKDKQTGKYESDFINCLAFDKRAETIAKFFGKGSKVLFQGAWQTGSYDKDGRKIYTNELLVENFDFIGGNNSNQNSTSNQADNNLAEGGFDTDFGNPIDDGDLPF